MAICGYIIVFIFAKNWQKVKYVFVCKINSTEFASAIDETFRSEVSALLSKKKFLKKYVST